MTSRTFRIAGEQVRRASARLTRSIVEGYGGDLGMLISCGYPKSGTVWLTKLLSTYLGLPYPQQSFLPIAMPAVIHAHWDYNSKLPMAAYIYRDGRDVIVSRYYHNLRILERDTSLRAAGILGDRYARAYGPRYDPKDIEANLPRFIEMEMTQPFGSQSNWPDHVSQWALRDRANVSCIRFEDLLSAPHLTLARLCANLKGGEADSELVDLSLARHEFSRGAGRKVGNEDPLSILRKGVAGDWRNYFGREALEVFNYFAGDALHSLGYV